MSLFGNVPVVSEDTPMIGEEGPVEGAVLDGGDALPPEMMEPPGGAPSADGLRGTGGETLPFAVAVPEGGVPADRIPGAGGYAETRRGGEERDIGAGTGGLY